MQEADKLFSIQTRMTGAFKPDESDEWHNFCFTCLKVFPVKKLHCGHYLSRFYKSARWDKDNARPQCMMDNMWKRGDPIVFRQHLIGEVGEDRVLAVEAKRYESIKMSREYLENLINSLTNNTISGTV